MIEYFEGPSCHKHDHGHIPPMESVKFTVAQYYTSLLSQFMRHKNNQRIHVSAEDRERWDNKSDSTSFDELEQELLEQIDALRNEIPTAVSQLTNDLGFVTESNLYDYGFITKNTIGQYIKNLGGITNTDLYNALSNYYTREYIDNVFAKKGENDGVDKTTVNELIRAYMNSAILWYKNDTNNPVRLGDVVEMSGGIGPSVTYTAGNGISINSSNVISQTYANSNTIGGIKTGYTDNNASRTYGVKLNGAGNAYVNVPWEKGEGGESTSGEQRMYFLNYEHGVAPSAPVVNDYDASLDQFVTAGNTWISTNTNPGDNQDTWAMWVWFLNGVPTSISGPAKIYNYTSGGGGSNGEDGEEIEWIYTQSATKFDAATINTLEEALQAYRGTTRITTSANIGGRTWYNHPSGISESLPYEYAAYRPSTNNSNGDRIWGQIGFTGPNLWSAYGEKGMDGDGVEYIFYANNTGSIPVGQYPNEWAASQQNEYTGPSGSLWQDNPFDIELLGAGAKQWVSIRKKTLNETSGLMEWGKFSEPTLWAYYAKDGVVNGYIVDLSNENLPVGTDENGLVNSYTGNTTIQVYKNGIKVPSSGFTVTIGNPYRSDGQSVSSSQVTTTPAKNVPISGAGADNISVTLTNITDFSGKNLFIPIEVQISDEDLGNPTYNIILTLYGIAVGQPGASIELKTSASVIKTNYNRTTASPSTVDVWCQIVANNTSGYDVTNYLPTAYNTSKFEFRYYYDDNSSNSVFLYGEDYITVDKTKTSLTVLMYYRYSGTSTILVDQETIPIVSDGAPGISGASAVNYQINVLSNTVECWQNTDAGGYYKQGSVSFSVYKTEGGNAPVEIVDQSDEIVYADMDGNTEVYYQNNPDCWRIYTTRPQPVNQFKYTLIQVKSQTETVLASAVVPFILRGEKGEKGDSGDSTVQSISGTIMRISNYDSSVTYSSGDVPDSNGICYKDVVYYNGNYYSVKKGKSGGFVSGELPTNSDYWQVFVLSEDAFYNNLIAKNAFIEYLTAREIVVTDNNNNPVAGITHGDAVSGNSKLLDGIKRGNIRIWAGDPTANGVNNLNACPFYVTDAGLLHANNAEITGTVKATSIYSTYKDLSQYAEYTIDPQQESYNWYVYSTIRAEGNNFLYLPDAASYDGLEINVSTFFTGGIPNQPTFKYYVACTNESDNFYAKQSYHTAVINGSTVITYESHNPIFTNFKGTSMQLLLNHKYTFKSIAGSWYTIEGVVTGE